MADLIGGARVTDRVRERLDELVAGARLPADPVGLRPAGRRQALDAGTADDPDDRPTEVIHPDPDWLAEVADLRRRDARRSPAAEGGSAEERRSSDAGGDAAEERPAAAVGAERGSGTGREAPAGTGTDGRKRVAGAGRLTPLHVLVLLGAVGLLVGVFGVSAWLNRPVALPAQAVAPADPVVTETLAPTGGSSSAPTRDELLTVHVLGDVERPGIVELPSGSRVNDALEAAGGLSEGADPAELNLAQPLTDGQQVLVGSESTPAGEVRGGGTGSDPAGSTGGSSGSALVNINTATATELETLPGVGPKTAEKIIAFRDEQGPFTAVDDLQGVSGIGPKTFAELSPLITV